MDFEPELKAWLHDHWEPDLTVREWWERLGESGWAAPTWPVDWYGKGLSRAEGVQVSRIIREFGALGAPGGLGLLLAGPTIATHGTDEQKRRYLRDIVTGAKGWCQLFSEPGAGSDLAGLGTRAVRDGDEWVVNGQKVWTSGGQHADLGMLLARTDPDVPKHAGITAFGVRMRSAGVTVRPLRQMNGDDHFSEVFLDDVLVEDADRLGPVGAGWKVAVTALAHERGSLGGGWGMVSPDDLISLAHQVGASAVARDRVAAVIAEMEVARLANMRARAAAQTGRPGPEGSGAKLRGSLLTRHVSQAAIDLLGVTGTAGAGEWETLFLTGPSFGIRGGTDEIQRNIVGERVLGLPPEPRADKDQPWRVQR